MLVSCFNLKAHQYIQTHTHTILQNTNKTSYLREEEFPTLHALSVYNFHPWFYEKLSRNLIFYHLEFMIFGTTLSNL